jgi:uncharacterized membrane protein YkvA (DUF1232 family)
MREQVESAEKHEAEHGTLARVVREACRKIAPRATQPEIDAEVDRVVGAVRAYVRAMPELVDATLDAAAHRGVSDQVKPIFDTAVAYINEDVDFIPDAHGLAGLVDDAYLVHGLMQEISRRHNTLTGTPLLPESWFAPSQQIRRLVGEPTATRLDVAVVAFARAQNVRDVVEQIVARIGKTGLTMNLPSNVAFGFGEETAEDLPELELGSLGEW